MIDKTLFRIRLSAVDKTFDMWIPNELPVLEAVQLAVGLLEEQEHRRYKGGKTTSFYLRESGEELDAGKLMGEYNFVDGTELILI